MTVVMHCHFSTSPTARIQAVRATQNPAAPLNKYNEDKGCHCIWWCSCSMSASLIPEHPRTVFVVVRTYVTSLWERKDDAKLSNKNVGVVRSDAPSYTPDHITRGVQPRTRQLCGCKQRHHLLSLIFRKVPLIQRRRVTDWVWDSNIICTREYLPCKMPCCEACLGEGWDGT